MGLRSQYSGNTNPMPDRFAVGNYLNYSPVTLGDLSQSFLKNDFPTILNLPNQGSNK